MGNPLDRTWYNTLIDDDGSGAVGTVWNKAQVDGLLDTVDASLAGLVDRVGTPAQTQLARFNDADTILGSPELTFDGYTTLAVKSASGARLDLNNTGASANNRNWAWSNWGDPSTLKLYAVDDAGNVSAIAMEFLRSGEISVHGGRLHFPPTQIPSASANCFDDYREFNWTPIFAGVTGTSGVIYSTQHGVGIKQGRKVTLVLALGVSSPGTISGNVRIWGLPYNAGPTNAPMGSLVVTAFAPAGVSYCYMSGYINGGSNWIDLTYMPAGGGTALLAVPPTMIIAGTTLYGEISYFAND